MTARDPPVAERVVVLDVVGLEPDHLRGERAPNLTDFLDGEGQVSLDASRVGGSHGRVDGTPAAFGLGGPAVESASLPETVDARAVAPTVADLLGVRDDLSLPFERDSVLSGG